MPTEMLSPDRQEDSVKKAERLPRQKDADTSNAVDTLRLSADQHLAGLTDSIKNAERIAGKTAPEQSGRRGRRARESKGDVQAGPETGMTDGQSMRRPRRRMRQQQRPENGAHLQDTGINNPARRSGGIRRSRRADGPLPRDQAGVASARISPLTSETPKPAARPAIRVEPARIESRPPVAPEKPAIVQSAPKPPESSGMMPGLHELSEHANDTVNKALKSFSTPEMIDGAKKEVRSVLEFSGVNLARFSASDFKASDVKDMQEPFKTLVCDLFIQLPRREKEIVDGQKTTQSLLTPDLARRAGEPDDGYIKRIDAVTSRMYEMTGEQAKQLADLCADMPRIQFHAHFNREIGAAFAEFKGMVVLMRDRTLNADLAAGLAARNRPVAFQDELRAVEPPSKAPSGLYVYNEPPPRAADISGIRNLTLKTHVSFRDQADLFRTLSQMSGTLEITLRDVVGSFALSQFKGEKLVVTVEKPQPVDRAKEQADRDKLVDTLIKLKDKPEYKGRVLIPDFAPAPDPIIQYEKDVKELRTSLRIHCKAPVIIVNGETLTRQAPPLS